MMTFIKEGHIRSKAFGVPFRCKVYDTISTNMETHGPARYKPCENSYGCFVMWLGCQDPTVPVDSAGFVALVDFAIHGVAVQGKTLANVTYVFDEHQIIPYAVYEMRPLK